MAQAASSAVVPDIGAPLLWRGVAGKLRNAFIGVSLFSIVAAVVGIASYEVIERAQDELLDRSLPAVLNAERLAKQGLSVIVATPVLLSANDGETLEREAARMQAAKDDLRAIIPTIRRLGVAQDLLDQIESDLNAVLANLERQIVLVGTRNALKERLSAAAEQATDNTRRLIEIIKPALVESSAALLATSDVIREDLSRPTGNGRRTLQAFEEMADVGFYQVERLGEMRFRADSITHLVEELLLTADPSHVAVVRDEMSLDLRSMARYALELTDGPLRSEVAQLLHGLSELTHGPASMFTQKAELIGIKNELDRLSGENRDRAQQLQRSVDALLDQMRSLIRASTDRARGVVNLGRVILATIAVFAFFAAIYVTWRYVLRDVAGRIRRLAEITRELARGNTDVDVDVAGDDELGEMADAVRVFKANATQLRSSNHELEQFAYVASHDLKAPLRGISNLATWIEQDIADAMSDESKEHMRLLHGRIDRMETLLEDLLQYSRAGKIKAETHKLDLAQAVPEVFNLVSPSNRFQLRITGKPPELVTARAPLEQVLRNLFGNAIKHHDAETGDIEFASRDLGPVYEFTIRDDGPGIPKRFQDKVFGMFQTLKGSDEGDGSGMGLAIVKKVVESVGGTITIESDPEETRGTTFRFTWPKQWINEGAVKSAA